MNHEDVIKCMSRAWEVGAISMATILSGDDIAKKEYIKIGLDVTRSMLNSEKMTMEKIFQEIIEDIQGD